MAVEIHGAVRRKLHQRQRRSAQALQGERAVRVLEHDAAMAEAIDAYSPDLVVLAGFMRILSDGFVAHYEGRLINIHPSLLPSFPGLHTHQRALDDGVRVHGCTVHFVTPKLDHGPIVVQAAVPVLDGDDATLLAARVLEQEHRIYPLAVRWFAEGRLRLEDGRVRLDAPQEYASCLISPQVTWRGP